MSVEIIQAIGSHIVLPICLVVICVAGLWKWK